MSINAIRQRIHWFMIVVFLFSLVCGSFVVIQTSDKAQAASTPTITEFHLPRTDILPSDIVARKDGSLWFDEPYAAKLGKFTASGVFSEVQIPTIPSEMISDGDGNVWFSG